MTVRKPMPDLYQHMSLLSEPVRVRLLRLLTLEELSVGELTRIVQLPQSTVSRHLKALRDAGWVERRTQGTSTLLRTASPEEQPQEGRQLWPLLRDNPEEAQQAREDSQRLASVLATREADSQAFFGRLAGDWDALRREMFGDGFWLPTLLALLPSEWTLADLGCGTGATTALLAPYVHKIIAIDREQVMLEVAARRLTSMDHVELRLGHLEALPLEDNSLDAALCLLVLHHVEDAQGAVTEAARVLKPGGRLLILDMVPHQDKKWCRAMGHKHMGFSPQALREMAASAGLQLSLHRPLLVDAEARAPGLFVCVLQKAPCA